MTEHTPHLGDEIQDLLDGRLDPAREAAVRAHLAECDVCRREWQRLEWLKGRLRGLSAAPAVPPDLGPAIRAALDRERTVSPIDASLSDSPAAALPRAPRRGSRIRSVRWMIAAGIAALLALTIGGGLWWRLQPPTPTEIAEDYLSLARGDLRLDRITSDPQALTRYFVEQRLPFRTRVFDLQMMQYTLVGGRVHTHRGEPAALFVYRGARGERVVCQMYRARPPSLAPLDRRTHNGIEFTVYRHRDVTLVFWDEGDETCVLASTMDPETLIQLAFAKAERRS